MDYACPLPLPMSAAPCLIDVKMWYVYVQVPCSCGVANCTARWEDTALHAAVKLSETKEEGEDEASVVATKNY